MGIFIKDSQYTVTGTVKDVFTKKGILDLHVLLYDKDILFDDFLGIGVTDKDGIFSVSFKARKFKWRWSWKWFWAWIRSWRWFADRKPDLYFVVKDSGLTLLSTEDKVIKNAIESPDPIYLEVSLKNDKLRSLINETPVEGWVGGFKDTNPDFAYPKPDLTSLKLLDNMDNIDKLTRQQKVLWPEFSWDSRPGQEDPKRCYQTFAPDISRLGYTDDGRVYSIICPQRGYSSQHIGNLNIEVTVTGNRGWVDESNKTLAADMTVEGRIWFGPSVREYKLLKRIADHFRKSKLPFPLTKKDAIVVETFFPGNPKQKYFPLIKGQSTGFKIPDFAKHEEIAWSVAHIEVEIGKVKKTGYPVVDKFNQMIIDTFNVLAGNLLQEGNILSWNVWFTAPDNVSREEWQKHADYWRESIEADHGAPDGPGTKRPRHYDGTTFSPLKGDLLKEAAKILKFINDHL